MIVTLASVRGSPGVTSWSLLLAAAWPARDGRDRVVLEADLAGGVLGARYGLGVEPGAVSLIASLRRTDGDIPVAEHGRCVGEHIWLVPGPESGEQAGPVWAGTAETVASRLAADERVWLVDAGRLDAGSVILPLAVASKMVVLVCRSGPEDLVQVPSRVAALAAHTANVGVLVVGRVSYSIEELREFFGSPTVCTVGKTDDLPALASGVLAPGRARRTWVWRRALEAAAGIAERVDRTHDLASAPNSGPRDAIEVTA
jgi:MinD-like ATPase involved in chromosome partitioning or flagellar assembly